jgi:hypothetical protein
MKKFEINGTYSMPGEMRNSYKTLVKNPEGKSSNECFRCILEINIKIDLEGVRCVLVWIGFS